MKISELIAEWSVRLNTIALPIQIVAAEAQQLAELATQIEADQAEAAGALVERLNALQLENNTLREQLAEMEALIERATGPDEVQPQGDVSQ